MPSHPRNGSGIAVIQPEGPSSETSNDFEVNPSFIGWSAAAFTYINGSGQIASGTFPNSVGTESSHADTVASNFYSQSSPWGPGIASGLSSIDNYNANYYYNNLIAVNQLPTSISSSLHNGRVVNQSFGFDAVYSDVDQAYDNYA